MLTSLFYVLRILRETLVGGEPRSLIILYVGRGFGQNFDLGWQSYEFELRTVQVHTLTRTGSLRKERCCVWTSKRLPLMYFLGTKG